MNLTDQIERMRYVGVCDNDYDEEPHIEFEFDDGDGEMYEYLEFVTLIEVAERLGIDCTHLKEHLPEFERHINIFQNMKEPDNIPASM